MFLNKLIKTNSDFVDFCIKEHQNGNITADSYVIDVDRLLLNAKLMLEEANRLDIKLYFMTKQIGRNPYLAKKLQDMGFAGAVVVDFKEAEVMMKHNIKIGNVGHLVQIPNNKLERIVKYSPEVITIFSLEIAKKINRICSENNIKQDVILKVIDVENDTIYDCQSGGFELSELSKNIIKLKKFEFLNIIGITSFPVLLFDQELKITKPTNNLKTLNSAKKILENNNISVTHMNMPSSTSFTSLKTLSELGATHGEPGHGLTGTTPNHLYQENTEVISYLYVSEISHNLKNHAYAYGGGYYSRGHMHNALIISDEKFYYTTTNNPLDTSIDYYYELNGNYKYGSTVILCYRTQLFVTRSTLVLVEGISNNRPKIIGEYTTLGEKYE